MTYHPPKPEPAVAVKPVAKPIVPPASVPPPQASAPKSDDHLEDPDNPDE